MQPFVALGWTFYAHGYGTRSGSYSGGSYADKVDVDLLPDFHVPDVRLGLNFAKILGPLERRTWRLDMNLSYGLGTIYDGGKLHALDLSITGAIPLTRH